MSKDKKIEGIRKSGVLGRNTTGINRKVFKDNKLNFFTSNSKKAHFILKKINEKINAKLLPATPEVLKLLFGKNGLGDLCSGSLLTNSKGNFYKAFSTIKKLYKTLKIDAITENASRSDGNIKKVANEILSLKKDNENKIKDYKEICPEFEEEYKKLLQNKDEVNEIGAISAGEFATAGAIAGVGLIATLACPVFVAAYVTYMALSYISLFTVTIINLFNDVKFKNKIIEKLKEKKLDKEQAEEKFKEILIFFTKGRNKIIELEDMLKKTNISVKYSDYSKNLEDFFGKIKKISDKYLSGKKDQYKKYEIDHYKIKFCKAIKKLRKIEEEAEGKFDDVFEDLEKSSLL